MDRMLYKKVFELSKIVSETIWKKKPTLEYAHNVAALLVGTAIAESSLRYRRQKGFATNTLYGAWGLWQCEIGSITTSLNFIRKDSALLERCNQYIPKNVIQCRSMNEFQAFPDIVKMNAIMKDDGLACLFSRLHYLRQPGAVPDTLAGQAEYWKKYYNTICGKGTVERYIEAVNAAIEEIKNEKK